MYAIKEKTQEFCGATVQTFERKIEDQNTGLRVEAGTTGYQGGSRCDGARSYLRIRALHGPFRFHEVFDDDGEVVGMEITCCGDDALDSLLKSLDFAYHAMDDQCCKVDD